MTSERSDVMKSKDTAAQELITHLRAKQKLWRECFMIGLCVKWNTPRGVLFLLEQSHWSRLFPQGTTSSTSVSGKKSFMDFLFAESLFKHILHICGDRVLKTGSCDVEMCKMLEDSDEIARWVFEMWNNPRCPRKLLPAKFVEVCQQTVSGLLTHHQFPRYFHRSWFVIFGTTLESTTHVHHVHDTREQLVFRDSEFTEEEPKYIYVFI